MFLVYEPANCKKIQEIFLEDFLEKVLEKDEVKTVRLFGYFLYIHPQIV